MAQYKLSFWSGEKFPVCEYDEAEKVKPDADYWDGNYQGVVKRRHKTLRGLKSCTVRTCNMEIQLLQNQIKEWEELRDWVKNLTQEDFED